MLNLDTAEILTYEQFWAKDPAPGTIFAEVGASKMELVGSEIDPELDDPDNAVMIRAGGKVESELEETYIVLKWGSWDTPENQKILELRNRAKLLMTEEDAQLEANELADGGSR